MRAAPRYGATVLAVILFMLAFRRSGERAGRLAERLETTEKANDVQRQMLEAAARRPRHRDELQAGCTTAGFESTGLAACPPVVQYSRELQARAADELALLPDGSAVVELIADYAVMRDQARVCTGPDQRQFLRGGTGI